MSSYHQDNPYAATTYGHAPLAVEAEQTDRVAFIRRTYMHLALAVLALVLMEIAIFAVAYEQVGQMVNLYFQGYNALILLGGFLLVSWVANSWALSGGSKAKQYLGLSLYVVMQGIIFLPILYIAQRFAPGSIMSAAIVSGAIFGGLTVATMITKTDFSFLRGILVIGSLAAFAFIGINFLLPMIGFPSIGGTGTIFATLMVLLASGYILYDTSNVIHHYRTDQHVAAALALFSSVALLFWYVLQLFIASRD